VSERWSALFASAEVRKLGARLHLKNVGRPSSNGNPHQITSCPWCGSEIREQHLRVYEAPSDIGRCVTYCGGQTYLARGVLVPRQSIIRKRAEITAANRGLLEIGFWLRERRIEPHADFAWQIGRNKGACCRFRNQPALSDKFIVAYLDGLSVNANCLRGHAGPWHRRTRRKPATSYLFNNRVSKLQVNRMD
jgi:hypothetical protein